MIVISYSTQGAPLVLPLLQTRGTQLLFFYYTTTVLLLVKYDKSLVDDRGKLRVIKENYV